MSTMPSTLLAGVTSGGMTSHTVHGGGVTSVGVIGSERSRMPSTTAGVLESGNVRGASTSFSLQPGGPRSSNVAYGVPPITTPGSSVLPSTGRSIGRAVSSVLSGLSGTNNGGVDLGEVTPSAGIFALGVPNVTSTASAQ
uniref:TIL domain containing protein n=1 Tax=Rhipicephalus appendiculatus TaxID=34631 RepID=A0A131YTH0_RHIAP